MSNDLNHVNCGKLIVKADSAESSGNRTEFEGIISSTRYDSDHERFGESALKQMARRADTGVKVLAEHNHSGQPIGRSLSAEYDEENELLKARFYIQKGLQLRSGVNGGGYADSDSYIAAAKEGTTDGLSVGAVVKKETCDHCGSEMKRYSFFGMTFVEDENGHYPGKTIYIDAKGKEHRKPAEGLTKKTITATIDEAELMEFSSVTIGANSDAVITNELRKAFSDGKLEQKHLLQLNDRFSIKVQNDTLVGGSPPMSDNEGEGDMAFTPDATTDAPEVKTSDAPPLIPSTPPTAEPATPPAAPPVSEPPQEPVLKADPVVVSDPALSGEYHSDFVKMGSVISELQSEVARLKYLEETNKSLTAQLQERNSEIEILHRRKVHVDAKLVKIQKYEALCEKAVDWSVKQFNRWKGTSLRPREDEQERTRLSQMDDYNQIMEWGGLYKNRADYNAAKRPSTDNKVTPESILEQVHIEPDLYV